MLKHQILLAAAGLALAAATPVAAQAGGTVQPLPVKGSVTYADTDRDGRYDAILFDYDGDGDTEVAVYDVDRDGKFESDWVDTNADGVLEGHETRIRATPKRRPSLLRRMERIRLDARGRRVTIPLPR